MLYPLRVWLAASALLSFGGLATAQGAGDMRGTAPKEPTTKPAPEKSELIAPVTLSTADYVSASAMSDLFEIAAGRVAMERSQNPQVRAFAEKVSKDHTANGPRLKALAAAADAVPPATLDTIHLDLVMRLKSLPAADFDATFVKQQLFAHQRALSAHDIYATNGVDAGLRAFAMERATIVEDHLKQAQLLDENIGEKALSN